MDLKLLVHSDQRNRPRLHAFHEPGDSALCHAILRVLLPLSFRFQMKLGGIEIEPSELALLRNLKGERCLLLPSHCGGFEPPIVLKLARILGMKFNYLAAVETFDRSRFNAWFMRGIGAYSVIRGAADRPSFLMTKRLLVEGRRWLVIFPEGHSVWQNDTVIPFQQGVLQLAFKAYEEVAAERATPSLRCIPLAIKYVYREDMRLAMDAALQRLEGALFAEPPPPAAPYERLRRVGERILAANERKHQVTAGAQDSLDLRIERLKELALREVESQLGLVPRADQTPLDRIRALFVSADQIVQAEPAASAYERRLLSERQRAVSLLYDDLWRMLQFVAIYGGYVREARTVERFMDMLGLLEMEVFGVRRFYGKRRAVLSVGEPVDLKDRFAAYRENKRKEVHALTLDLEHSVRAMLTSMAVAGGTPMPDEGAPRAKSERTGNR